MIMFSHTFKHLILPKSFNNTRLCFSTMVAKNLRVALLQLNVVPDRKTNLENAAANIVKAKHEGAELVVLPECFNSPYGVKFFNEYAETIPDGPTCQVLSQVAKDNGLYVLGGTIPERDNSKLYNTCTVWNPNGELIAKYRKMHLFDIDIPGTTFKESDALCSGNNLVTFKIDSVKFGIGICYDIRFEELAKLYRQQNCDVLIYPAAFTMKTGEIHWELLQCSRAVDNQVFVFGISPARADRGYIAWGHSQITSPWGKVLAKAGHEEEVIYCDINLSECDEVRQQIPVFSQRRVDIYNTILNK